MNNENDYKYILEDFSTVFIGANYKYEELLTSEAAPYKYKEAVARVFTHDVTKDFTIAEHLCQMTKEDKSYFVYHQLKAKVKVIKPREAGKGFESKTYKFDEFMEKLQGEAIRNQCFIEEIIIKKLHLISFVI